MDILKALKAEESKLVEQLDAIQAAIKILGGKTSADGSKSGGHVKPRLSASARARISKAQKARWAKVRAAKKT